ALFRLFPSGTGEGESVQDLAGEIAALVSRLQPGERKSAIPVALLGLRFELPQKEHPAREYALNQVVASALHRAPGLRVLERWQSEALLFERIAMAADDSPIESGAIYIEGVLSEKAGSIHLALTLRRAEQSVTKSIEITEPG